jgi:hypothetical protein
MHGQEDDDQGYDLGDNSDDDDGKRDGEFEEMPK